MKSNNNITTIYWHNCSKKEQTQLLNRPINNNLTEIYTNVKKILHQVSHFGDNALIQYNLNFDQFQTTQLKIQPEIIINAGKNLSIQTKKAIQTAINNINQYHQKQYLPEIQSEIISGVHLQQIVRPINTVGLYVPGGTTPLPSTVMMLGIPARIAQCKRVILCSPPPISEIIIYTAKLCGITEIYQVGGSQAIAAMGFGTESIPKVDKIFGPGNVWVTEAKRQMHSLKPNGIDIDMLAGPSEVLIIADETANPIFIAADLLSQAEHDPNSHAILLASDVHIVKQIETELCVQLQILPRKKIIIQALRNSYMIITDDIIECFSISNKYAPEHLIIQIKNASNYLKYVTNAGSVFLGHWSPGSAGDYASGSNHVLPTYGHAITKSSLGVIDFQKRITVQQLTQNGLLKLSSTIITLAQIEQLKAHEYAIIHRINHIKKINEHTLFS